MNFKLVLLLCCILVSCQTPKKIIYMKDADDGSISKININPGIKFQPKDMLSIIVSSGKPELAVSFNLPLVTSYAGSEALVSAASQTTLGYVVDMDGNIDFPIFGKIKVAGLTRLQLAEILKQRLIKEDLIADPIITIEILNFKVIVLGEVAAPGTFVVTGDRITILEALSKAGDLTIQGRRHNVLVVREKDGFVAFHRIDLRSENLIHSPVYNLQQNDVVYVEPTKARAEQSKINENRSMGMWFSLLSLVTTLSVLLLTK